MKFDLIVAADDKRGIGKNNTLPWHIKQDLHRFATITRESAVIMGRKTWESIPESRRPLKDRINIVLTTDKNYKLPENVELASSLEQAIESANTKNVQKTFIIGGGKLFAQAIKNPDCHTIWYTRVKGDFHCDAFFPEIPQEFVSVGTSSDFTEGNYTFCFEVYRKRS